MLKRFHNECNEAERADDLELLAHAILNQIDKAEVSKEYAEGCEELVFSFRSDKENCFRCIESLLSDIEIEMECLKNYTLYKRKEDDLQGFQRDMAIRLNGVYREFGSGYLCLTPFFQYGCCKDLDGYGINIIIKINAKKKIGNREMTVLQKEWAYAVHGECE